MLRPENRILKRTSNSSICCRKTDLYVDPLDVVPSVAVALIVCCLGRQESRAVILGSMRCRSLWAGGGIMQSGLCTISEWETLVYLWVLGWPSSLGEVFWHLHVALGQWCEKMLHTLTESERHLQHQHTAPQISHLKRVQSTDIWFDGN